MSDDIRLKGLHQIRLFNEETGALEYDTGVLENVILTSGKNLMLNLLFGINSPQSTISYLGIGTDTTAPAAAQTQLNPSIAGSVYLQALDPGTVLNTGLSTVTYQITIPGPQGNFIIGEGGAFNGPTNGTSVMLNRILISPTVTKNSSQVAIYVCSLQQI